MIFNTHATVLAVDDESDVLSLTKMVLRDMTVFGLPVHVETATSKAEAIEILERYRSYGAEIQEMIAVALIDVVMETGNAGLELCEYIRTRMDNRVTQLYIRTGQAGGARVREVIDNYDISGYFTKTELDEDKLYSLVKAGIRQANTIGNALAVYQACAMVVEHGTSRRSLDAVMRGISGSLGTSANGSSGPSEGLAVETAMVLGGTVLGTMSVEDAEELRSMLIQMEHCSLNQDGDFYTCDDDSYLIYVAPSPVTAESYSCARTRYKPTTEMITMHHAYNRIVAAMWKRG